MHAPALAKAVADLDEDLLALMMKVTALLEHVPKSSQAHEALKHLQETLAVLSHGTEMLVATIVQNGSENPSWN